MCCSPWCCRESDVTERLNNNNILTGNAARKKKSHSCHDSLWQSRGIKKKPLVLHIHELVKKAKAYSAVYHHDSSVWKALHGL